MSPISSADWCFCSGEDDDDDDRMMCGRLIGDASSVERAISEAGDVRRHRDHLRLDQARRTLVHRTHQRPQQPGTVADWPLGGLLLSMSRTFRGLRSVCWAHGRSVQNGWTGREPVWEERMWVQGNMYLLDECPGWRHLANAIRARRRCGLMPNYCGILFLLHVNWGCHRRYWYPVDIRFM